MSLHNSSIRFRSIAVPAVILILTTPWAFAAGGEGRESLNAPPMVNRTYPSGHRSPADDRTSCEVDLASLSMVVDGLLSVGPNYFAQLPVRNKIKLVHGVVDHWDQILKDNDSAARFVNGEAAREQLDTFLRRSRVLRGERLMKLQRYADEVLIVTTKLSSMYPVVKRMLPSHAQVFRHFLETSVRLITADVRANHARRAVVFARIADLRTFEFPARGAGASDEYAPAEIDARRAAAGRALEDLRTAVAEDRRGIGARSYVDSAANLLTVFVAAHSTSRGADRIEVKAHIDELLDLLEVSLPHFIAANAAGTSSVCADVVSNLLGVSLGGKHAPTPVPGTVRRMKSLVSLVTNELSRRP